MSRELSFGGRVFELSQAASMRLARVLLHQAAEDKAEKSRLKGEGEGGRTATEVAETVRNWRGASNWVLGEKPSPVSCREALQMSGLSKHGISLINLRGLYQTNPEALRAMLARSLCEPGEPAREGPERGFDRAERCSSAKPGLN